MNKTQLVDALALAADLPKAKANLVLDTVLDLITQGLVQDKEVPLTGFGKFLAKIRAARTGRDPRTGGALQIPEKIVVSFKAGKFLEDAVNDRIKK